MKSNILVQLDKYLGPQARDINSQQKFERNNLNTLPLEGVAGASVDEISA